MSAYRGYDDPVESRYGRDAQFRALVDMLRAHLHRYDYSPTEMREAVMLACVKHEQETCRTVLVRPMRTDRAEGGGK